MKLSQLQQLTAISRYGSFTKAAQALYITQPALSVSIRELECELGEKLLVRTNRSVVFTQAGEQVLIHAQRILEEASQIYQLCRGTSLNGTLSLGGTPHHCASLLISLKLKLEEKYTNLTLDLAEYDSRTTLELVENCTLTAGLVQLCDIGEDGAKSAERSKAVQLIPLFEEEMVIAVSQNHPLLSQSVVTQEDLYGYPYTAYQKADNIWVKRLFTREGSFPSVLRVHDTVPLRLLLESANGYTIIPQRALHRGNSIYRDPLVPLQIPELALRTTVFLAVSPALPRHISTTLQESLAELSEDYLADPALTGSPSSS